MAIVPFNRGPRPPVDPLADVSDAHKLMAIGQLYQNGDLFDPTPMDQRGRQTEAPTTPGATYNALKATEAQMESDQDINARRYDENAPRNVPAQNISEKKNIESLPEMPGGGGGGGSAGGAMRSVPDPMTAVAKDIQELRRRFDDGEITREQFMKLREPLKARMGKAMFK